MKKLSIRNFRGIGVVENLSVDRFNIFIGNNGVSKTSILEAINFAFSPNFLAGRIKHTDFNNGEDRPIDIEIELSNPIIAKLPDGYTTQEVPCNKISLNIKKRDRKAPGKAFSDMVTLNHILVPDIEKDEKGWKTKRKSGSYFEFTERSLSLSQISTDGLPRCFFYGKERDRQIQKGFNSSFSNVIEDLSWRFLKKMRKNKDDGEETDLLERIDELQNEIKKNSELEKNDFFIEFKRRKDLFNLENIDISLLDSGAPYDAAFLSLKANNIDIPVKQLGSGVEMIVSLLFLETMASFSKEKLLILIDEPELHLHPNIQKQLADYLLKLTQDGNGHQIFVTTHSPIFFKNCVGKNGVKAFINSKDILSKEVKIDELTLSNGLFPWSPSWGEINYFAYDYPTVEFHDELYGFIQNKENVFNESGMRDFFLKKGLNSIKTWKREKNNEVCATYEVPLPVFIRNKIHHPENKSMQNESYTHEEMIESIKEMITIIDSGKINAGNS